MSWLRQAHKLFELMALHGRELERKDLVLRLGMTEQTASNTIARLRMAKCIAFAYGSKRNGVFYRFIPGSSIPESQRGKSENSRKGTAAIALRRRAARPPTAQARWKAETPDE